MAVRQEVGQTIIIQKIEDLSLTDTNTNQAIPFGQFLKEMRELRGRERGKLRGRGRKMAISQHELSINTGASQGEIVDYEGGLVIPRGERISLIADYLGFTFIDNSVLNRKGSELQIETGSFGTELRSYRHNNNLSQKNLDQLLGFPNRTTSTIERGRKISKQREEFIRKKLVI